MAEQVHIVIVCNALQDGSDTFQPHAGVDGRFGQVETGVLVHLLELHEHKVPEFQVAVAVFFRRARRATRDGRALIVEYFRAKAAGPRGAHGPQVAFVADDPVIAEAGDLLPELTRLIVSGIDRDQQLVLGQPHHLGDKIPGEGYGVFLEVIAEGEIPQHLEESVMPGGVADIVQIIVLAAGAHAFLRAGGALIGPGFVAGEEVLKLHHAGVGEH